MRFPTLALAVAVVVAAVPTLAVAEDALAAERAAIVQLVNDAYVDGVHNFRDPVAIRRGFHSSFEMVVLRDGKLERVPLATWIEGIEARNQKEPPPKWTADAARPTTARFAAVDVAGTAAACKVEIFRDGRQLFTDYLALYKFADGWKIVGKTFYRHPEVAAPSPAPGPSPVPAPAAPLAVTVPAAAASPLIDTQWALVRLGEKSVAAQGGAREPHIVLLAGDDRRLGGTALCNNFSGTYTLDGDRLKLKTGAMTRMACPPGPLTEGEVLAALSAARGYRIRGAELELLDEAGKLLALFVARRVP